MRLSSYLSATQAAAAMTPPVTVGRVSQLISAGKLPAQKIGRQWFIAKRDLQRLKRSSAGRPKKI